MSVIQSLGNLFGARVRWANNSFVSELFGEGGGDFDDDLNVDFNNFDLKAPREWRYRIDNDFALAPFSQSSLSFYSQQSLSNELCAICKDIIFNYDRTVIMSELRTSTTNCQLCKLLLSALERVENETEEVRIIHANSALQIHGGQRLLGICSAGSSNNYRDNIPIGFPVLPEIASPIYFDLLRAWLRRCNKYHRCNYEAGSDRTLPTRLLYVGHSDRSILYLHITANRTDIEGYISLSHCWGNLSEEIKEKFLSTTKNIDSRQQEGFSVTDLPRTFQDAVRVTRELGQQYIWIDSLCILQDDLEDWNYESSRMEDVFASADCVIAASSATDSEKGFLKRKVRGPPISTIDAMGRRIYICEDVDDFENDVGKAPLNKRGWVLQERFLSRRTIHFSANHTYWECGEGVCCENLNRLESPEWGQYFQLDPVFPWRLTVAGGERTIQFLNNLFRDYSMLDFTKPTDRVRALSGLQSRIARTLDCKVRYGISGRFLQRNLLWCGKGKMERITYNDIKAPSWSWMAYRGGIDFIQLSFKPWRYIHWQRELKFDTEREDALIGSLGEFRNCTITRGEVYQCAISDSGGIERGWIEFDVEDKTDIDVLRCVVVGRKGERPKIKYLILVVQSTATNGEYERVGAGLIQSSYVSKLADGIRII